MNFYNGFSPAERGTWSGLARPVPRRCSMCGCGPERPVAWHAEDYRRADSVYPVCRRCHHAIHIRFRRPDHWRRYVAGLDPAGWHRALSLDPASLWRPFDETYPEGLPPSAIPAPREPQLPLTGINPPNELMMPDGHDEWMDAGAAGEAGGGDPAQPAVVEVDRPEDGRWQGGIVARRL